MTQAGAKKVLQTRVQTKGEKFLFSGKTTAGLFLTGNGTTVVITPRTQCTEKTHAGADGQLLKTNALMAPGHRSLKAIPGPQHRGPCF